MSTFVVGDIHGHLPALEDLLSQIGASVRASDTVVFIGDYIDRGPESRGCVDRLLAFRNEARCPVVFLAGNHEDWMLKTMRDHCRHSWLLGMDGLTTIRSYSEDAAAIIRRAAREAGRRFLYENVRLPYEHFFAAMPDRHQEFFVQLRSGHATDDCICAHAGVSPWVERLADQQRKVLLWGADGFPEYYVGDEIVVYGHFDNAAMGADDHPYPTIIGNTIGIDTISHGVLTAVRLPERQVLQSARYAASER